jgi:hypothetical protein
MVQGSEIAARRNFMGRFTRQRLEEAFSAYDAVRIRCSQSGDWSQYADLFTQDAIYIEHAYGTLHGREAIRKWITEVMAPFPHMQFPQDWVAFDTDHDAVLLQAQNLLPHPTDPEHPGFGFPTWTRLIYAGDGLWSSEEDVYNPARDTARVIKAWRAAGGEFATAEQVRMQSS